MNATILIIAMCSLALSLAALIVARRSSEREKRLVLAQRRSDMIAALRETRRALEMHVMNLEAMVKLTKDAVHNTRLERLFEDAQEADEALAGLRTRLESTPIPPQPTPAIFRDMDEITADVMTVRRAVDHHAGEAAELRTRIAGYAAPEQTS